MYTEPPLAGRASSDRPNRPAPRAAFRPSAFGNGPRKRPSAVRRMSRALARFSIVALISVGATLAWQSYGARMVRAWAPSLGRLLPASPPGPAAISAEVQTQLKPVALDLAKVKRSVEQLATNQDQLTRKEDQLAQAFATLQAARQDIDQKISPQPPGQ